MSYSKLEMFLDKFMELTKHNHAKCEKPWCTPPIHFIPTENYKADLSYTSITIDITDIQKEKHPKFKL